MFTCLLKNSECRFGNSFKLPVLSSSHSPASRGPWSNQTACPLKTPGAFPLSQLCSFRFLASSVLSRAMAEGMMEWRPLKILSSVKTMRTAAKISRTDFLRTQKINQRASVYWRKKIKVRISVRTWALWCCNLLDLILHSLVPQEPWKPAACNLRKASSNLAPFSHLAGSREDPTCKTCLCLIG